LVGFNSLEKPPKFLLIISRTSGILAMYEACGNIFAAWASPSEVLNGRI
jgi:hypothetical protein